MANGYSYSYPTDPDWKFRQLGQLAQAASMIAGAITQRKEESMRREGNLSALYLDAAGKGLITPDDPGLKAHLAKVAKRDQGQADAIQAVIAMSAQKDPVKPFEKLFGQWAASRQSEIPEAGIPGVLPPRLIAGPGAQTGTIGTGLAEAYGQLDPRTQAELASRVNMNPNIMAIFGAQETPGLPDPGRLSGTGLAAALTQPGPGGQAPFFTPESQALLGTMFGTKMGAGEQRRAELEASAQELEAGRLAVREDELAWRKTQPPGGRSASKSSLNARAKQWAGIFRERRNDKEHVANVGPHGELYPELMRAPPRTYPSGRTPDPWNNSVPTPGEMLLAAAAETVPELGALLSWARSGAPDVYAKIRQEIISRLNKGEDPEEIVRSILPEAQRFIPTLGG